MQLLAAGDFRRYPDETLRSSCASPSHFGRLSLRITKRWNGQLSWKVPLNIEHYPDETRRPSYT
ncbi:MAG: hypothetical protein VSS75_006930 [Candidatus Parabeggiatoa sp.]|nr:hypothetical protein [Candidatus Parabeggiatoa sp.]